MQAIKAGKYQHPFMSTIEENGKILALCQMTPPHLLNVIIMDDNRREECVDLLTNHLLKLSTDIPSLIGSKQDTFKFAEKWNRKTGLVTRLLFDQGLYRLDQVNEQLEASSGYWRLAEEKDMQERWSQLVHKNF